MFEEGLERLLEVCLGDAVRNVEQAVQYCGTIVLSVSHRLHPEFDVDRNLASRFRLTPPLATPIM